MRNMKNYELKMLEKAEGGIDYEKMLNKEESGEGELSVEDLEEINDEEDDEIENNIDSDEGEDLVIDYDIKSKFLKGVVNMHHKKKKKKKKLL